MEFTKGMRAKFSDITSDESFSVGIDMMLAGQANQSIDFACFGVDEAGHLVHDDWIIFYNQLASPNKAVQLLLEVPAKQKASLDELFRVELGKIPAEVEKLVFTATLAGAESMSALGSSYFRLFSGDTEFMRYRFSGSDFGTEKAVLICEIYRKGGIWRLSTIGQGFAGGLSALLHYFGGEEAVEPAVAPVSTAPVLSQKRIDLDKKIKQHIDLSKNVENAKVSLAKVGLSQHVAQVALVLDISASMTTLFKSGKIREFARRILALAVQFDDDGSMDVFVFGERARYTGGISVDNFLTFLDDFLRQNRLELGTQYSLAIKAVVDYYFSGSKVGVPVPGDVPVYAMFLTDGQTSNERDTKKRIVEASYLPIFWQFMGIGPNDRSFPFLQKLDTLRERYIDNAGFFSVTDPSTPSDGELYDKLMSEYPAWLKLAEQKGLLSERAARLSR
jgi:stress response protein SCP2